jgi:hypothetical protein
MLPPMEKAPVIAASRVVAAGRDAGHEEWALWMAERYSLSLP